MEKKIIKDLVNKDFSNKEIAKIFNCSESNIRYFKNKYKISKMKRYNFSKEYLEKLWNEHKSLSKISSILKCAKSTVINHFNKHDIKPNYLKLIDINTRFNKLIVISFLYIKKGVQYYQCLCDCGNITIVRKCNLVNNATKSCGCLHNRPYYLLPQFKGYKEIPNKLWHRIQYRAKTRNLEFLITIEYAWDLFIKQNRKCVYSNETLCFNTNWQQTASLDRINSSKGYIEGNVQWVHKNINIMKSNFTEDGFLNIIKKIYEYRFKN